MNTPPNIDHLIARAKRVEKPDNRAKNKGRPYKGIPQEQVKIISAMRKKNCSLMSIFRVMKEDKLTTYKNYGAFNAAWKSHRVRS